MRVPPPVGVILHRIVWLLPYVPVAGILLGDYALLLLPELEVLVLDRPGVGSLCVGVVHHRHALHVRAVMDLVLEPERPILKGLVAVAVVLVDRAGEDDGVRTREPALLVLEEINAELDVAAVEHLLEDRGVASLGDALERVGEVVVVVDEPKRDTPHDGSRELCALMPPLFLGVAFDQLLVDGASRHVQDVLLEIGGVVVRDAIGLDRRARLIGSIDAKKGVEGVHIEGHVVELAMEVGHGRVNEIVELAELSHVVPDCPVRRPEDMGAVEVDIDAFDLFRIAVAADVPSAVENEHALTLGDGFMSDYGTK